MGRGWGVAWFFRGGIARRGAGCRRGGRQKWPGHRQAGQGIGREVGFGGRDGPGVGIALTALRPSRGRRGAILSAAGDLRIRRTPGDGHRAGAVVFLGYPRPWPALRLKPLLSHPCWLDLRSGLAGRTQLRENAFSNSAVLPRPRRAAAQAAQMKVLEPYAKSAAFCCEMHEVKEMAQIPGCRGRVLINRRLFGNR